MIKYADIADLPENHPMVQAFMGQLDELDSCYRAANTWSGFLEDAPEVGGFEDEESLDHFNRYIAGDR